MPAAIPAPGHDAVPVMISVTRHGHIKLVFQIDQGLHGVLGGRIHADLAIPVQSHEAEGGIDLIIDQRKIQAVALRDRRPVVHAGPAQRVHAEA